MTCKRGSLLSPLFHPGKEDAFIFMEFGQRLEKLEGDIKLISTIRDLLMSSGEDDASWIPQRLLVATNRGGQRPCGNRGRVALPERPVRDSMQGSNKVPKSNKCAGSSASDSVNKAYKVNGNIEEGTGSDELKPEDKSKDSELMEQDRNENLAALEAEKIRRIEVEESAKIVMIRLQKVEDDLVKEKDIKRNLLEGTLQMKNQLQGYQTRIYQLEATIDTLKNENIKAIKEMELLEREKHKEISERSKEIQVLQKEKDDLLEENQDLQKLISYHRSVSEDLKSASEKVRQTLQTQSHYVEENLQNALTKCTELENQKKDCEQQLTGAIQRIEELSRNTEALKSQLDSQLQQFQDQIKCKDSEIDTLKSNLEEEKTKLMKRVESATQLVSKTKVYIVSLKNEKDSAENKAQKYQLELKQLKNENQSLESTIQSMKEEILRQSSYRDRFWSFSHDNSEKLYALQHERDSVKTQLQESLIKFQEMKANEHSLKLKIEELTGKLSQEKIDWENSSAKLRQELQRQQDNFQVLQKISEDQGKTISKQRTDLQSASEAHTKLEMQLRECHETERALSFKLVREEQANKELESQLSTLEKKMHLLNQEIQEHECEEFLECKVKSKLDGLEKRISQLQNELASKEDERDKAVAAARTAVQQTKSFKNIYENQMLEMKNSSAQEALKMRQQYQQELHARAQKVRELEMQLARAQNNWKQMQGSYITKINQLQTALQACVSTGNGFGHGIPTFQSSDFSGNFNPGASEFQNCAANFNFSSSGINNNCFNPFL